ncbi:metH [Symbiodinium natans]|uniref:MetH protein n=1 Tax=Symbiodinium natans TaxID=878477 RepID=A0A812STL3_9DINO|nr:metH [Symbiodinium natans]
MGKFVRRCAVHAQVSKLPVIICSMSWDVIAEGLKSAQGKCIVNGISMASSEEDFVRVAAECRRFGAAIVVLAMARADGEFPNYQEKVTSCQRAYHLLRSELDFPAEDGVKQLVQLAPYNVALSYWSAGHHLRLFCHTVGRRSKTMISTANCIMEAVAELGWVAKLGKVFELLNVQVLFFVEGSHGVRASPKDFIDAVAEVRRTRSLQPKRSALPDRCIYCVALLACGQSGQMQNMPSRCGMLLLMLHVCTFSTFLYFLPCAAPVLCMHLCIYTRM